MTIYLNGFTAMTPDEVAKSIGAAAAAWGPDSVTCPGDGGDHPYFEILPQLASGGRGPLSRRTARTRSSSRRRPGWRQSRGAGLHLRFEGTERTHRRRRHRDQRRPGLGFEWANLDPGAPPGGHLTQFDLQTVMTHEFGHFLGLAHTCVNDPYSSGNDDGNDAPMNGKDDMGQPIPSCDDTGVPQYAVRDVGQHRRRQQSPSVSSRPTTRAASARSTQPREIRTPARRTCPTTAAAARPPELRRARWRLSRSPLWRLPCAGGVVPKPGPGRRADRAPTARRGWRWAGPPAPAPSGGTRAPRR